MRNFERKEFLDFKVFKEKSGVKVEFLEGWSLEVDINNNI